MDLGTIATQLKDAGTVMEAIFKGFGETLPKLFGQIMGWTGDNDYIENTSSLFASSTATPASE